MILALTLFDVIAGLAIFFAGAAVFAFSLWRIHQRLVRAKAEHVARAARVYDEAVSELRKAPTDTTLARDAQAISCRRPARGSRAGNCGVAVDGAVPARLFVIITGVVTAVISAFVLNSIGIR